MTIKISAYANNSCSKTHKTDVNIATKTETVNNAHKKISVQSAIQTKDGYMMQLMASAYVRLDISNGTMDAYCVKWMVVNNVIKKIIVINVQLQKGLMISQLMGNVNVKKIHIWMVINVMSVDKRWLVVNNVTILTNAGYVMTKITLFWTRILIYANATKIITSSALIVLPVALLLTIAASAR